MYPVKWSNVVCGHSFGRRSFVSINFLRNRPILNTAKYRKRQIYFATPWDVKKTKAFQLQGGFSP